MSIVSLDLDRAINTVWDANLDWEFKKNWEAGNRDRYPVLHDQEATPAQPWPYCVVEVQKPTVAVRMTGHDKTEKHEIRDTPVEFRIHAREMLGSGKSAKAIAGELADLVLAYFGGHPTAEPKAAALAYGDCLLTQYQSHFGTRTGDDEYQMTINYLFRLDMPVKV